jgi:hypothetical protein
MLSTGAVVFAASFSVNSQAASAATSRWKVSQSATMREPYHVGLVDTEVAHHRAAVTGLLSGRERQPAGGAAAEAAAVVVHESVMLGECGLGEHAVPVLAHGVDEGDGLARATVVDLQVDPTYVGELHRGQFDAAHGTPVASALGDARLKGHTDALESAGPHHGDRSQRCPPPSDDSEQEQLLLGTPLSTPLDVSPARVEPLQASRTRHPCSRASGIAGRPKRRFDPVRNVLTTRTTCVGRPSWAGLHLRDRLLVESVGGDVVDVGSRLHRDDPEL